MYIKIKNKYEKNLKKQSRFHVTLNNLSKKKSGWITHRFGEFSVVDGGETAEVSVPEDRLMIHLVGGQYIYHIFRKPVLLSYHNNNKQFC
jgi:hypothetical protein